MDTVKDTVRARYYKRMCGDGLQMVYLVNNCGSCSLALPIYGYLLAAVGTTVPLLCSNQHRAKSDCTFRSLPRSSAPRPERCVRGTILCCDVASRTHPIAILVVAAAGNLVSGLRYVVVREAYVVGPRTEGHRVVTCTAVAACGDGYMTCLRKPKKRESENYRVQQHLHDHVMTER